MYPCFLFIDTCQGDSGGPLLYYSYDYNQWMIAGITSYGCGCGLSNYAGVYTRVSMYIDWIKSTVGKDGVVTTGENGANIGTMSNMFYIAIVPFLVLLPSF
jgi:secreted trypsin-like serine protease